MFGRFAKLALSGAASIIVCGLSHGAQAQERNWSGFYAGLHAGGAWSDAKATDLTTGGGFFAFGPPRNVFDVDTSGFIGGAQLGLLWQTGRWVYGAEVSYSWTDLEKQITSPYFPATDTQTMSVGPVLMITGKLGYSYNQWLPYLKAGYAGGNVEFNAFDRVAVVNYNQDGWHNGWTIGAGLEYAMSSNVSLGVEYNYVDLGSRNGRGSNSFGGAENFRLDADLHAVTARLNFRFGNWQDNRPDYRGDSLK